MNKTTKGALAVGVAAVLLTGGAGTLAYWNATQRVTGTPITSGQLELGLPACGSGWTLDGGTVDLIAKGDHIGADLGIGTAGFATTNALASRLTPAASFTVGGASRTHITDADDTGTAEITAKITVTCDGPAATNASQAMSTPLNSVAVTATQTHDV